MCEKALEHTGLSKHKVWGTYHCDISLTGQSQVPALCADVSKGSSAVLGAKQRGL